MITNYGDFPENQTCPGQLLNSNCQSLHVDSKDMSYHNPNDLQTLSDKGLLTWIPALGYTGELDESQPHIPCCIDCANDQNIYNRLRLAHHLLTPSQPATRVRLILIQVESTRTGAGWYRLLYVYQTGNCIAQDWSMIAGRILGAKVDNRNNRFRLPACDLRGLLADKFALLGSPPDSYDLEILKKDGLSV